MPSSQSGSGLFFERSTEPMSTLWSGPGCPPARLATAVLLQIKSGEATLGRISDKGRLADANRPPVEGGPMQAADAMRLGGTNVSASEPIAVKYCRS